jgi:ABC-type nitrate/sulfonate/bicarbonate transport system substrate-binding protein
MLAFLALAFLGVASAVCTFTVGSFGPGGDFLFNYANTHGYFPTGFTVCFQQIANSTDQYNRLQADQVQLMAGFADNVIGKAMAAENIRNDDLCLISGGDLGPRQSLSGNKNNGIFTLQDLQDKDILVDSPDTGAVVILYKILHDANITGNTFTQAGGSSRLSKLIAGTFNGHPTYATMNFYPSSALLNAALTNVAFAKDYYWPYQSGGLGAKCSWAKANHDTLVTYFEGIAKAYYWFVTNPTDAIAWIAQVNPTFPPGFAASYYASYFQGSDGPVTTYSLVPHRAALCKNVVMRQAIQDYGMNYFPTWIPMNDTLVTNAWTYVKPTNKPNQQIGNGNNENGSNKYRGPVFIDALLDAIENITEELNIPEDFPWEHPTSGCKNLCDIETAFPGNNGIVACAD